MDVLVFRKLFKVIMQFCFIAIFPLCVFAFNPTELVAQNNTEERSDSASEAKSRRFFVGIGVGEYKSESIPRLLTAVPDVQRMKELFLKQGSIRSEHAYSLYNQAATLDNIRKLFVETLPKVTRPDDIIIIYWSGHGGMTVDIDGDEANGYDECLLPYNADYANPKTLLIDDDFGEWMLDLSYCTIFIVLDTCYSAGTLTRFSAGKTPILEKQPAGHSSEKPSDVRNYSFFSSISRLFRDLEQKNLAVIASSLSAERTYVRLENDASVMSWFIYHVLNERRGVSHRELYREIRQQVADYTLRYYGHQQMPVLQDDIEGVFIVNP